MKLRKIVTMGTNKERRRLKMAVSDRAAGQRAHWVCSKLETCSKFIVYGRPATKNTKIRCASALTNLRILYKSELKTKILSGDLYSVKPESVGFRYFCCNAFRDELFAMLEEQGLDTYLPNEQ